MAKRFQLCELCHAYKLVNYAGLCKYCNRRKAAGAILEEAAAERDAHHAADMEAAAKAAEKEAAEAEAGEAEGEEKPAAEPKAEGE